jgi:alpha-D-ribose 1-methylphosphonate 5-triphosphate diphosphatase
MKPICLYGGPVFDGTQTIDDGMVLFSEAGIIAVSERKAIPPAAASIDVQDAWIIPGLVDLHSDALEKCIEMRPGVFFDGHFALKALDQRLAACGITTFFHAISFGDDATGIRTMAQTLKLVELLKTFAAGAEGLIRHRFHARCEISSEAGIDTVIELMKKGQTDLVSVMDHTPGQGQFRVFESFERFYADVYQLSKEAVQDLIERKKALQDIGWEQVKTLAMVANHQQIPLLSHDDDTAEKVALLAELGVTASEFPVTQEAATAAKKAGIQVFMGAPNLLRGASSNHHLSARETVAQHLCNGLISDYYPECLVQAPFVAARSLHLDPADTLHLVTSGPGTFLDRHPSFGFLKPGSPADIAVVDPTSPWVRVRQTWVGGRLVFMAGKSASVHGGSPIEKRSH